MSTYPVDPQDMRTPSVILAAGAVLGLLSLVLASQIAGCSEAHALSGPVGSFQDYQVTCASTATSMLAPGGGGVAFTCYSATPATSVFIGGSDVDTTGYCKSNVAGTCSTSEIIADGRTGASFCRVASGTVVLNCLAGRP